MKKLNSDLNRRRAGAEKSARKSLATRYFNGPLTNPWRHHFRAYSHLKSNHLETLLTKFGNHAKSIVTLFHPSFVGRIKSVLPEKLHNFRSWGSPPPAPPVRTPMTIESEVSAKTAVLLRSRPEWRLAKRHSGRERRGTAVFAGYKIIHNSQD